MDSETVYSEDPVAMARQWEGEGAGRLHVVDLDGALSGERVHASLIERLIQSVRIPIQVGGGVREMAQIERYLSAGAAGVILGTAALRNESLVREACKKFPRKIIAGIDSNKGAIAVRGWTELHPEKAADLAARMEAAGAASIILTDIERDGMLSGPNMALIREVAMRIEIPIIASGGVTTLAQIKELSQTPGVEGAIIGKALYSGRLSLPEALAFLQGGA